MRLSHGLHLAYCTNVHRGEDWPQTFASLQQHALDVRRRVCPNAPFAIGLRLSAVAARQLKDPATLTAFQHWLADHDCYVFTINGFPYGQFHGTRVKEQVYVPDWTTPERLDYTNLLLDLLAEILPPGIEGSVSTVPVSFKAFHLDDAQLAQARANLWHSVEYLEKISQATGKQLHLGLEPEPLCQLETTAETVQFFEALRADRPGDPRLDTFLGVNYDCCHLAVEFEEPRAAISRLCESGIKISKIHLSNALIVVPTPEVRAQLKAFADDTYLHQVIIHAAGQLTRIQDLPLAFSRPALPTEEWRIHFHIPLHSPPTSWFGTTSDHVLGVLDAVAATPGLCSHFEMETYTWEVMPPALKQRTVAEQLAAEYEWTLRQFSQRGFRPE